MSALQAQELSAQGRRYSTIVTRAEAAEGALAAARGLADSQAAALVELTEAREIAHRCVDSGHGHSMHACLQVRAVDSMHAC